VLLSSVRDTEITKPDKEGMKKQKAKVKIVESEDHRLDTLNDDEEARMKKRRKSQHSLKIIIEEDEMSQKDKKK